jgi:hypothetical protein
MVTLTRKRGTENLVGTGPCNQKLGLEHGFHPFNSVDSVGVFWATCLRGAGKPSIVVFCLTSFRESAATEGRTELAVSESAPARAGAVRSSSTTKSGGRGG